jgi:hypothetical protein
LIIYYLNTDLDLVSECDLIPLVNALETRGIFPLHVTKGEDGRCYATLETDDTHGAPESNISAMLDAIEALDEDARCL